ncbi:hypothetical protein M6I34_04025 [Burkholderiaceae bacterium FT117]|uniref:N-acyl amino acid synthase FeeM domain-containing protein n=1 Tax=Zeimonas sediminis TaxID=2944268 RepID=UPI002342E1C2|nr:hypothetical protein [Zeimonas sediminis]MCM5569668.1 hypothetical protein [Zeimonas sediminis]
MTSSLTLEEVQRTAESVSSLQWPGGPSSIGKPLPFRVRVVRTNEQLEKAISLRAEAYGRHVPELATVLDKPEEIDRSDKAIIFLAESKEDGSPVGTLRMQTNLHGPLSLEQSVVLPQRFQNRPLAGVTRLAVKEGRAGKQVKLVLFKTLFRYCFATQIEWIIIGARPPLDSEYRKIGFEDVFDDQRLVPFVTAEHIPHRVLAFDVLGAERKWFATNHRLYKFMAYDYHPDIEVFASISGMWSRPRRMRRSDSELSVPANLGIPLV